MLDAMAFAALNVTLVIVEWLLVPTAGALVAVVLAFIAAHGTLAAVYRVAHWRAERAPRWKNYDASAV